MGKTSAKVKDKYNEKTYTRYVLRVKKGEELESRIKGLFEGKEKKGAKDGSFNSLIERLLKAHFGIDEAGQPDETPEDRPGKKRRKKAAETAGQGQGGGTP
jgi:hypothetical protein